MNDRLKFRAFDTFTEKMIQNHISICEGELYEWCPDGLHIKHDIGDSAIVMQCTGLKDKNGKLIYEGDILKIKDVNISVEVKYGAIGFYLYAEPTNTAGYHNDKYIPEDCEVIGNIYENKELLKELE